jgi:hypothetical protein
VVSEGCCGSQRLLPFTKSAAVYESKPVFLAKFLTVFGAKQRFFPQIPLAAALQLA